MRNFFIWAAVVTASVLPVGLAAFSPLLAYRDAPYIAAGMAGAIILSALLIQPLLGLCALPQLTAARARKMHRLLGPVIALAVFVHVGGLYLTSPPDTIDALLLVSPTPFSIWGVAAMVGVFLAVVLAGLRKRLGLRLWRGIHYAVTTVIVLGSVIHALLISGTMEFWSKLALCTAIICVLAYGVLYGHIIRPRLRRTAR